MFEQELFEKITKAWELDQNHPHRGMTKKPIPEISEIRTIIEISYLASLKREEGRDVTFSIVILSKQNVAELQRSCSRSQIILSFDHSLPLTVESIIKLAPASHPKTTALIAGFKADSKTDFEIWGMMFFGSTANRFNEIPATIEGLALFRPDLMIVTALSAGSLLITRGDSQIGRFTGGDFITAIPSPFVSRAMGNYIMESIKENKVFLEHQNIYWHIYRDSLDYLLSEASARGRGGTIIIIPENKVINYRDKYFTKFSFDGGLQVGTVLDRMLKPAENYNTLFYVSLNKKYSERLDALAQLTCIDGALILSSCLEVVSFGTTLKAPEKWKGEVLIGPDGFGGGGEKFNTSKLGTRHNSAIDFIGDCPSTFGFVLSQDGPIRGLVRKDSNTILCRPDCRVSMFA